MDSRPYALFEERLVQDVPPPLRLSDDNHALRPFPVLHINPTVTSQGSTQEERRRRFREQGFGSLRAELEGGVGGVITKVQIDDLGYGRR